jgi:heat shock protein HslJ
MRSSIKLGLISLGLFSVMLIIAACATTTSQKGNAVDLTSSPWALLKLKDMQLVVGTGISARFTSDGKLSGSSGCNQYSGTYTVSGNTIEISSPLATTRKACPQVIMDQETEYLKTLSEVKTFSVTTDKLTLSDVKNNQLLLYEAVSQDLAGTSWEAISYNNGKQAVTTVLIGTNLTAEFAEDGTISGESGCNSFSGSYEVTGNQITIGPLATTRMACNEPVGVMEQETQYLAALQSASSYLIEGNVLELRTKDGALAANFNEK